MTDPDVAEVAQVSRGFLIGFARKCELERAVEAASAEWNALPGLSSGPMGSTPDAVKFATPYRSASRKYKVSHAALGEHNRKFCKMYAGELRAMRAAQRANLEVL
jgi:hypothetical protein